MDTFLSQLSTIRKKRWQSKRKLLTLLVSGIRLSVNQPIQFFPNSLDFLLSERDTMDSAKWFQLYSVKKKICLPLSDVLSSRSFWMSRRKEHSHHYKMSITFCCSFKGEILTITTNNYLSIHGCVHYFTSRSPKRKMLRKCNWLRFYWGRGP